MNPLRVTFVSVSSLAALHLALACQSGPSTSSSSNWVVCDAPSDCAEVADAVDCVDGYCVDQAGERVEQSGSGGSGDSGSGGASGGGAALGSGGENLGGAGSASGGTGAGTGGAVGELTCEDFDQLATCEGDQDCTTGERQVDCCGNRAVTGVSVAQEDAFGELASSCQAAYPACGCPASVYPMTDEGRALTSGEAGVSCVEGMCRSWVGERPCGDALTCAAGEICLFSNTVLGPTETVAYACVDNPCTPSALSCDCAAPSCELGDGRSRLCTISGSEMADVLCQDQAQ